MIGMCEISMVTIHPTEPPTMRTSLLMKKSPWRMVVEALVAEGVERIFGLSGNPTHLVDDLAQTDAAMRRDEQRRVG